MAQAIFVDHGTHCLPTDFARGPWTPEAQHGGPPAALLARAVERFEGGADRFVARITVELLRPVPIAPLVVQTRLTRPGRKVQLVEASLAAGDVEVARATAIRLRAGAVPLPADLPSIKRPPGPDSGGNGSAPWSGAIDYTAFHSAAVEHRFVGGAFDTAGPATDWIRLRVPLVEGESTSPLCRVVAVADFGNGISSVLDRRRGYTFINPDLTIYLYRLPATEWVCLDANTQVNECGVGLAESRLFDELGPIGRAAQSLIIERVDQALPVRP